MPFIINKLEKMTSDCYKFCNSAWGVTEPSMRLYCKKGCDGDGDTKQECKKEYCGGLCIKDVLGDDDNKLGKWTTMFARAPMNSDQCLEACIAGCHNKVEDD